MRIVKCAVCNKDTLNIKNKDDKVLCENCTFEDHTPIKIMDAVFYLETAIRAMQNMQKYECEERYALYQVTSILMEFRQELQGGYLSVSYMKEKCDNIMSRVKELAEKKGMYNL